MKKVLYVSHLTDLSRGGQRSLLTLVEHLDRSRIQPYLLVAGEGELADRFRQLGAEVFVLPFPSLGVKRLKAVLETIKQIRAILRGKGIEIVHSDNERATLYCGLAARKLDTAVLWHVRVAGAHHLDRMVVAVCDRLIGISDGVFRRFPFTLKQDRLRKVFNGVDLTVFRPAEHRGELRRQLALPEDRFIAAYVGQINARKGVLDLLTAWQDVVQNVSGEPPLLLVIGRRQSGGDWEPELDRLLETDLLKPHVREIPQQSNIQDWFAAVDMTILPSHNGVEGMGRVLFEAMACGAVALGSDTLGVNEAITPESGVLFEEKSPAAIAATVTRLIEHPDVMAHLRRGGLERAKTVFDVKVHAQKIQQVYDEFASRL